MAQEKVGIERPIGASGGLQVRKTVGEQALEVTDAMRSLVDADRLYVEATMDSETGLVTARVRSVARFGLAVADEPAKLSVGTFDVPEDDPLLKELETVLADLVTKYKARATGRAVFGAVQAIKPEDL